MPCLADRLRRMKKAMVFRYDEEGNKLGWDYPSYFKNTKELDQLKKEGKEIALNFLLQSGWYDTEELTYVKTEAYKDYYPWQMQVFFEKGQDMITVSLYTENKMPFEYEVIKSE